MIEVLREYVEKANEKELQELIGFGYEIIYQDVSLSVIYEEIENCYENHEMRQRISEMFGYYGLSILLYVNGVHYWIMQV